jgi:hypothetical protein
LNRPDLNSSKYKLTVPARINTFGNPGNDVEGDFATLSAVVNIHAYAQVKINRDLRLEHVDFIPDGSTVQQGQRYSNNHVSPHTTAKMTK